MQRSVIGRRTSEPQNLRTSEPQNLRTSEPQNLRTSEPQNLRTSEPQNLRTSEPQNLRTSEPQNLRTSEPQNLRTSEPQNLRTSEPQNLRTSEPQNLRTSEPLSIAPEQISYALKAVRLEQGLSQTTLAKLTRFQLTAISLREQSRYQSYPALSTLEIYCKAFGITVSSFLRYASSLSLMSEEAIS